MNFRSIHVSRTRRGFVVALLLFVLALQLVHVARVTSANWDEAHHLYDGYRIWTMHDYRLNAEVPPLVKMTAALPLLPMKLIVPPHQGHTQAENAFLDGRVFVFSNGGDRVLFPARMACMVFTLLLAWLMYAWGREMFGTLAALFALAMFVFDPLVLAHGMLVSTDLGSACFIFATVFAFYRYTERKTVGRLLLCGLLAGLAMVTKFTGIFVGPILLLLAVAEAVRACSWEILGRRVEAVVAVLLCAWLTIWIFYGFRYAPAPHGAPISPALGPYLASLQSKGDAAKLALIARFHLLPEAYIWGLANTKHTEWEYMAYFFGRVYRHGPWEYFPAAFLIKSTLPLLILLLLTPVVWVWSRARYGRELYFLLIPVVFYFAVICSSHFDIGARHMLPMYPFLYLLTGATAAMMIRQGWIGASTAAVLLLWQVVTSVRVAPAYMAYGNEAWGGPLAVRKYLSDSNVDWGQQLKAVKIYLDRNHITNCWFVYFPDGAVQPQDYGIDCHRLPTPSGLWWLDLPMNVPPVINGTVLISESDLDGVESGDGPLNPYASFQKLKPVAILQDGIYVYQGTFAVPLAAAWVDVRHSIDLDRAGQKQAAMQLAAQAVALAQNSANVQLNYANMLLAQGDWKDAMPHYEAAQTALEANRPALEKEEFEPGIIKGMAEAKKLQQAASKLAKQ